MIGCCWNLAQLFCFGDTPTSVGYIKYALLFGCCTNLKRKLLFAALRFRPAHAPTPPSLTTLHFHGDHEGGGFRPVVEEYRRYFTPAAVVERAKLGRCQLRRRSCDWFVKEGQVLRT